jgi:hypothetical protein
MGLVSYKMAAILIAIVLALLFILGAVGPFGLHWTTPKLKCLDSYHHEYGPWKTFYRVGHIELRYKPAEWVCPPNSIYDPKDYEPSAKGALPQDAQDSSN